MAPLGWAKGYFLSTTWRPLEYWSPSQRRNKKPNIGWKGRECPIAIAQNTKSEIPTCKQSKCWHSTGVLPERSDVSALFKSWTILLLVIILISDSINVVQRSATIIFTTATSSSPETAILRLAAISDLHLPNLPQIARRGIEGQCRNKYDFHSAHSLWPSWVFI